MRYHKLPKQLKVRVRNYFYHRYNGRLFNEKTMLKELSHVLEEVGSTVESMNLLNHVGVHHKCLSGQEITKYNYREVLDMVPMFKNAEEDFLNAVVSKFSYEVFLEGDLIINSYVHGTTMYFIQHGEAQVLNCNGEVVRVLVDGDYFGGL